MLDSMAQNVLAILGRPDVVLGFKALGFSVYPAQGTEEGSSLIDKIVAEKPAICLVEEEIYLAAQAKISSYRHLPVPIFIPFAKDERAETLERLTREIRLRATGTF